VSASLSESSSSLWSRAIAASYGQPSFSHHRAAAQLDPGRFGNIQPGAISSSAE
jgi:hypothetical protein